MRRSIVLGLALMLALVGAPSASGAGKPIAIQAIGIQTAELTSAYVFAESQGEFSGFVETGSLDSRCIVSLSETNIAGIIRSAYCAPRQIERDGRLMNGLFLHVFADDVIPEDAVVVVNYYQERMVTNPPPIPCDGTC